MPAAIECASIWLTLFLPFTAGIWYSITFLLRLARSERSLSAKNAKIMGTSLGR